MDRRRHSTRYLMRRLAAAHHVLRFDPDYRFSDQQRHRARCRLNRTLAIVRRLPPVPLMRRSLEVDRLAERRRAAS